MVELDEDVRALIRKLFPPEEYAAVEALIHRECNDDLPNIGPLPLSPTNTNLVRIRYGALKLSNGDFAKLQRVAKMDWRDILVAAGFGNSLEAHKDWAATVLD